MGLLAEVDEEHGGQRLSQQSVAGAHPTDSPEISLVAQREGTQGHAERPQGYASGGGDGQGGGFALRVKREGGASSSSATTYINDTEWSRCEYTDRR